VVFLDADDLLLPGALARRSALLGETDAAWAHTEGYVEHAGTRRLFSDHRPPSRGKLDGDLFADLLLRNFITTDAVIARRSVVQALGGFDEEIRGTEDWDLWLRLAARHPVRYSPEPTFVYRRGTNTLSSDRRAMDRMRWLTLVKAHRRVPAKVRAAGTAGRRSVADAENGLAYLAAREGRWREASAGLFRSVRLAPRQGRAWAVLLRCLARAASTTRGRHG
jgi:GT2 family glycosyltransferase